MARPDIETAVLIVGAGPVGLALANELGWRGIDCRLVERRDGAVTHPRMNQVSVRTMEYCRRWGVAEEVAESGIPEDFPRSFLFVTAVHGHELARFEYPPRKGQVNPHSPEIIQRCSQLWFDPILRRKAASYAGVTLAYETELREFAHDADGVSAEIADMKTGETRSVRAGYIVGCDGADSAVREALGIPLDGPPALSHDINVLVHSTDLDTMLPRGPAVMQWIFGADGLWADIVAIDGRKRWRLGLMGHPPGSTVSKEEAAGLLRRAVGRDFEFEIVSVLPWSRRQVVASRYRDGRAFIAGDSGHQMSPTGGFGMNTGIAEAVDLGWKLAAVLDGWGGPDLLDSYAAERLPIARRVTTEGTHNFRILKELPCGPEIADDTPEGMALRRRIADTIRNNEFDREYDTDGVILGYRYEDSPVCWPDGTPPTPDEPMVYVPTARPGHRAPHAWLADGRSTLDLFGKGFTLLRFDAACEVDGLQLAAQAQGVPFAVADIDDAAIRDLYAGALVLVRPDGHVAWRGDDAPADEAALIERVRGA